MPPAVMAPKLPIVALVLWLLSHVVLNVPAATYVFESSPPPARSHVGDDITMEWTLSSDPQDGSTSAFFYKHNVSVIRRTHGGADTIDPGYEGRVSFYSTSSRGIGFRLNDVTLSDAGSYRCRHEPRLEPTIDSSSVLFIFGEPSTPVISLKRYGQIGDPFTGDLKDGDSVTLLCAASSTSLPAADRPAMTYAWTRNGQPIDRDIPPARHSVPNVTGGRLDISRVSRNDNVTYRCTAREEGSNLNSQTTLDLNVLYPPGAATVTVPPPSPVVQGSSLTVTCSLSDPGNPPARVVYRPPNEYSPTTTNNRLVISAVTLERDDGTWGCYGENTAGTARQATFDITVHVPPRVIQNLPATETIDISHALSVSCSFEGRPAQAIQWTYGGSAVLPVAVETVPEATSTEGKLVTSSSRLQWKASSTDAQRRLAGGVYRCTATNAAGTVTSTAMTLDAQYAPYRVTVTPSSPVTTVEGESLELEGSADCNPSCQYSWTLDGVSLTQDTSGRLQIDSISRDKHGTYALRAYNDFGSSAETVVVNVNYPPTVTMMIDPEDGLQSNKVEILCTVDSTPPSEVTWTNLTSSGIPRGTVSAGQRQHYLTLDPADCLDSGTIRCTADNGVTPTASDQRELNVFCPPRLDPAERLIDRHGVRLGDLVIFLVYVIANPARATWTYTLTTENGSTYDNNVNGVTLSPSSNPGTLIIARVQPHHYGDYDVTVTNTKGALQLELQLDKTAPPELPEKFEVRVVTCASVTLQWRAGFNGGSPQTFHLSYRMSGAAEWGAKAVEDSGQGVISHKVNGGIEEQTVYEFKLFAKNVEGQTKDISLTTETTACPKFVADSLVISIEDNIATISWEFTQRVDRVEVQCCNDRCTERTVDQPTAQQPITMEVPPGNQNYIFTFKLFQDGDLVFSSEIEHDLVDDNNAAIIAAVTTTVIVVIIVIVVVIVVIVLRRKRRVSKRDATPLYENTAYQNDIAAPDTVQHKSTEKGAATEFEASQVEIQTLLSDGTGFQVHSAQVQIGLSLHAAVIKRVKDAASPEVYSRYMADQMSVLLSLKHVNVVKLLGFQRGATGYGGEYENVASMSSLSLVLEPATQGDLHTFLTGHGAGVYQKTVTMETMMGMALEIATGAHALSKNKPAVLHHYICAKHVLVDDRGVCKLTGFSTAEAVRARDAWEAIHKSERPVRWVSAETLNHLEHTTKSDVWSFAIFLWELFSLGEMPYPGLEDDEVETAIQDGNRLEKPNNCDPTTYDLMVECWIRNIERRPDFQYVMNCLMKYRSEKTNASADEHTYETVV